MGSVESRRFPSAIAHRLICGFQAPQPHGLWTRHGGTQQSTAASAGGRVKVRCQGRLCFVGALVLGDDVLLGAVPMDDMDLTINPSRQR